MGKLPIEPEEANLSKQRSGPLQPKLDDFKLACFPGNLTFYVAGRLLQRLSWYWQQSYLLSGPICQTADLQELGLSQVITNHCLDRVLKEKVGFLKDSTTLANNCFNLITSLVNYLPVNADQVLRMQKLLATIWRQADEGEGSFALSQFYRQGTSAWRRAVASDYAEKMSEEHVRPFVDQMQIVLLEGSGDIQRNRISCGEGFGTWAVSRPRSPLP